MRLDYIPRSGIQAKNLPDRIVLKTIDRMSGIPHMYQNIGYWGNPLGEVFGDVHIFEPSWVHKYDLFNLWPTIPSKVIMAKLRGLIRRGLITGCACGCRGDFELTDKGRVLLNSEETK